MKPLEASENIPQRYNESKNDDLRALKKNRFNWESVIYKFNHFILKDNEHYYNKKLEINLFVKRKRGFFIVKNGTIIFDTVINPISWDDMYERLKEKNILLEYIVKGGFDDDI